MASISRTVLIPYPAVGICRRLPSHASPWISETSRSLSPELRIERSPKTVLSRKLAVAATDVAGLEEGEGKPFLIENSGKETGESYDWTNAWYPAAMISELDPKIPTPVTILGYPMVIWWDKNSDRWQVFLDKCPHRLAPLSEGRIHESGQIQCSYHGWTFGGDGGCGLIPQASKPTTKDFPRACATVVTSVAHQGLLFVWPDTTKGCIQRSAAVDPPFISEFSDDSFSKDWGLRDMPYGADILMENLVDPSHFPFAHHNIRVGVQVQGNRDQGKPRDLKVTSLNLEGFKGTDPVMVGEFSPPCLFTLRFTVPKKEGDVSPPKFASLIFFCVPTTPGQSRLFFSFPNNFLPKVLQLIPVWYTHLGQMLVLDSDMYLLHLQERTLEAQGGSKEWSNSCFVPTSSDAFVIAYRRWFNTFGGGSFDWPGFVDRRLPPTPSKEQLLDRNKSHVAHCKACRGAQKNFERLQFAMAATAFLIVASLAALSVAGQHLLSPTVAAALVAISGALAFGSHRIGRWIYKSYYFHDYCHALIP